MSSYNGNDPYNLKFLSLNQRFGKSLTQPLKAVVKF